MKRQLARMRVQHRDRTGAALQLPVVLAKLEFERAAEESRRLRHQMEDIYLAQMQKKDPTMTLEKLRAMLPLDLYMDSYKAVRLGLADGIIPWPKHKKIKPRQDPSVQETPLS